MVRNELISMCTESRSSILRSQSPAALRGFTWNALLQELAVTAPILLSILQKCTHTRRPRPNQAAVIGMCFSILLKHRFSKMCLMQKILTLILYGGHSGKQVAALLYIFNHQVLWMILCILQVYERLQKVNVTMSHKSSVRLLTKLGDRFDTKLTEWRDKTISLLHSAYGEVIVCITTISINHQ